MSNFDGPRNRTARRQRSAIRSAKGELQLQPVPVHDEEAGRSAPKLFKAHRSDRGYTALYFYFYLSIFFFFIAFRLFLKLSLRFVKLSTSRPRPYLISGIYGSLILMRRRGRLLCGCRASSKFRQEWRGSYSILSAASLFNRWLITSCFLFCFESSLRCKFPTTYTPLSFVSRERTRCNWALVLDTWACLHRRWCRLLPTRRRQTPPTVALRMSRREGALARGK